MRLNLYENSPPVVGFEMLPDFSLLQVLSLLYFFSMMSPWYIWTYKFCLFFSCSEPMMHLNLYENGPQVVAFEVLLSFFCYYYYTSSVSVFQLQWALGAFEPVQEWPSGSCLFVTIQVLSLFFSCSEPLMRLNLYKNGPLAVGFLLPYKFSLCFSAAMSPWCVWTCMRTTLRQWALRFCQTSLLCK